MGALCEACEAISGTIAIESVRGRNTKIRLMITVRIETKSGTSLKPAVYVSIRPPTLPPLGKVVRGQDILSLSPIQGL
jgi:hypothetical protein